MRKLVLLFMALTAVYSIDAQVKTPPPSPLAKLEQKVGLTDITLEYSRPSVKGRTVFGDLVPFGSLWRTGANKNTTITVSTNISVDGQTLKAGSYAIYTKPGESLWEVFFYTDTENSGNPKTWDESKVAAITTIKSESIPFNVETFTIDINNITNNGATLDLVWEKTYIGIPFTVPTDDAVLASINDALGGTPEAQDYYASALYYFQEGKDIKQSKEWIDLAVDMTKDQPKYWYLRQQALISAKAGDTKAAIAAAKSSLELAKKAGSDGFVKMNTESLKEWGAM